MKFLRSVTSWSMVLIALAGCATEPDALTVVVTFSGCGQAFDGSVAGVVVGPGLAVTVAHGVIQGDGFRIEDSDAQVVALDLRSDLALLEFNERLDAPAVRMGNSASGDDVWIVGGLTSPQVAGEVASTPTIRIAEVLGTNRVSRAGLELRADLEEGDSGAGVFGPDQKLVGIVFAVNDERDGVAWGVASSEIETLMASDRGAWECVSSDSRLGLRQP